MGVLVREPGPRGPAQPARAGPLVPPQALLLQGAHHACGLGLALGVMVAGECLPAPQGAAGLPPGAGGRLPSLIAHEGQCRPPGAIRALAVDRQVPRQAPRRRGGSAPGLVPIDRLGAVLARHDLGRSAPFHRSTPPLSFHSGVSAPARVVSLAFSRAQRASCWLCCWPSNAWVAFAENGSCHRSDREGLICCAVQISAPGSHFLRCMADLLGCQPQDTLSPGLMS
jgi:hypothetical protein